MAVRETVRLTLVRVVSAATRRELEEDISMMIEELEEEGWQVNNAAEEDLALAEDMDLEDTESMEEVE